jgi:hypothetical protein
MGMRQNKAAENEIITRHPTSLYLIPLILLCRPEHRPPLPIAIFLIDILEVFIDSEHARQISRAIAVVRGGPDRAERTTEHSFAGLLDELVGAGDEGEGAYVVELSVVLIRGMHQKV